MALAPLAAPSDVAERLGRELTAAEEVRTLTLLEDASGAVRSYTGQEFTEATETVRLKVRNGYVTLPQRPVTAVSAVVDTNGNAVTFDYLMGDRVSVVTQVPDSWAWEPYRNGLQVVDVTYTHGYDETPPTVVAVVCQMAARALGHSAEQSALTQASVGDASQTFGVVGASGGVGMLPDERAALDRFRRHASVSHAFA